MPRVVIVGGGISGLALAFRLEQSHPSLEVVVLEESARLGGKIDTAERAGFRVEAGPNGFLDSKPATLDLCRELGLGPRLVAASEAAARNRFLLLDGRLRALPSGPVSFLLSDVLSWPAKLSLLAERFRRSRPRGDDESIDAFARRRVGREVAETLADAFVTGIHAGDPKLLSARAAFPRLVALEQEHGSVLGGLAAARRQRRTEAQAQGRSAAPRAGQMWSFREGLCLLVQTLCGRLRQAPQAGVRVTGIRREERTWRVEMADGRSWTADAVALTCPAYQQAALLRGLDADLAGEVGAIPYNRIAVVGLGYRAGDVPHPLDGFGYLSRQRERRDVLGVQWCSSIFPDRAPPGMVLLRALCGGWNRPDVVDWDDDRLVAAVSAELAQAMRFRAAPVFRHVVRWDRALPQYQLGHLRRVARVEALAGSHPGLFLGGNAYHGVALNDCVERAAVLARQIGSFRLARE
jgi:oxygen-dependent protoporphyrinogen oxidase